MTREGTQPIHIDFLYWESDVKSSEIKQYIFVKGDHSPQMLTIMNRAARDIDGCIGVTESTDLGEGHYTLLLDPIAKDEHDDCEREVHAKRDLFAKRVHDHHDDFAPLTTERIRAGMAVNSLNADQDKLETRKR